MISWLKLRSRRESAIRHERRGRQEVVVARAELAQSYEGGAGVLVLAHRAAVLGGLAAV